MIRRKLTEQFLQLLKNKREFNNIILVDGARQVGKTTLVRQVVAEADLPCKEFNLEEKRELAEKIDQCANFDEFSELVSIDMRFKTGGDEILFIDEAQESRRLGAFVRFMKEKWNNTQVILSGSIMSRMFRDDVRFPVGRITPLHLQPFSFSEFLLAVDEEAEELLLKSKQNISKNMHTLFLDHLQDYINVGGLPEVVTTFASHGNWQSLRRDLIFGYYNDFKRVYGEEKQSYFIASLQAVANLLGQPFKNSHVSQLMDGGKNKDVIDSLGQLEAWRMIFKIEQRGMSVETNYHPKRYFFDVGIARELREAAIPLTKLIKTTSTLHRKPLGGLIENVTMLNIINQIPELSGWKKSSSGAEVDFVLKLDEKIIPIECKAALSIKNSHLGGLRTFMETYNLSLAVVVSLAPFEVRYLSENQKVINLPLYLTEFWQDIIKL